MPERFLEQFGAGQGVILGIQILEAIPGDSDNHLEIIDIQIDQTNLSPKRTGQIIFKAMTITKPAVLKFDLTDEAYDQRTLQGYAKKRNPDAVTN